MVPGSNPGVASFGVKHFHEAMSRPEHNKWHLAILEELVDPALSICNIVRCQFILQKKCGANGSVTRYKAHLVAQGFSQHEGINYSETFAPVVKSASLRIFLAICACHGWRVHQMDIKSAYLNGSISEDIYMQQPKGYEEKGGESKVTKLK